MTDSEPGLGTRSLPGRVASRVVARLVAEDNELTLDPEMTSELARRIDLVVRVVAARLVGKASPSVVDLNSADLGGRRAAADVHPAASLRAATVTFEELYPALLGADKFVGFDQAVKAAVVAQDVVGSVILDAATGYVDHLLMRLSAVHIQERRALAAYLHDHTAQALAAAIQRLSFDKVPVGEVKSILESALTDVRTIAFDLRQFVGNRRVDEALGAYIQELRPRDIRVELGQVGVPRAFSPLHQEATFLILREAVLNAVKHSRARRIEVRLGWQSAALIAIVKDDGRGFDIGLQGSTRLGLIICRERAESMSALLELHSAPGEGTSLELRVPL